MLNLDGMVEEGFFMVLSLGSNPLNVSGTLSVLPEPDSGSENAP